MGPERRLRAERLYAQAFAEVLRELKTELPAMCSVVRVDMSPDLRLARVHLSMYGDRAAQARSRTLVERARPYLQGEVGRRMGLRFTPALRIVPDRSIPEVVRLAGLTAGEREDGGHGDGGRRGEPPTP